MWFIATEQSGIAEKTVVFGGTFDPVHQGHIKAAKSVSKLFGDIPVRMMLAGNPRLRDSAPVSSQHRWHMLQLACAGEVNLIPDNTEIQTDVETHAIDTVEKLGGESKKPVILALGDDAAAQLRRWVRYESIRLKTSIIILKRTNACLRSVYHDFEIVDVPNDLFVQGGRIYVSTEPVVEISASTVRDRIRQRKSVDRWIHPAVYAYIIDTHLYQT